MVQTTFVSKSDLDKKMSGSERYQIAGTTVSNEKIQATIEAYKGMSLYWNCLEKAQRAQEILQKGIVTLGSLLVWNKKYTANYGYLWNPPYEFHAWLNLGDERIFDPSLPGVIIAGITTIDKYGSILEGRTPFILNGVPPKYTVYKHKEIL